MASLPVIPSADSDTWSLAEGSIEGRPSVIRFRPTLKEYLGDARYPRRLQITWTFQGDGQSGMPSSDESEAMESLEDLLVPAFERAEAGLLAFVFTHGGNREWHFYVSPSVNLGAVVNDALASSPAMPIKLNVEDDPEWSEFAGLLESVSR